MSGTKSRRFSTLADATELPIGEGIKWKDLESLPAACIGQIFPVESGSSRSSRKFRMQPESRFRHPRIVANQPQTRTRHQSNIYQYFQLDTGNFGNPDRTNAVWLCHTTSRNGRNGCESGSHHRSGSKQLSEMNGSSKLP